MGAEHRPLPPDQKDTFRLRKCPSSQDRPPGKRFRVRFPHTDTKDNKVAFSGKLPRAPGPSQAPRPFLEWFPKKTFEKLIFIEKYCLNCLNRPCASSAHWIRGADPQFVTTDTSSVDKCLLDPRAEYVHEEPNSLGSSESAEEEQPVHGAR